MAGFLLVTSPEVSVIIPARNEEAALGPCLRSLTAQSGVAFEIIVVDDNSNDRTREVAQSFSSVLVVAAPPLASDWTGKNNAVVAGAKHARGQWLLFTDADTVHLPGSLARSLAEAKRQSAALLSYSPEQEMKSFWERAIMPVIFAELARTYRPSQVSDPNSAVAAANGQYLLVTLEAYDSVGGHAAVGSELLEDVALAQAVKSSGRKIYFRYGGDAVRTRMYRSFAQLREGWTKNLALLFSHPGRLASVRLAEFSFIGAGIATVLTAALMRQPYVPLLAGMATGVLYFMFLKRIQSAHFSWTSNLLAILGLPFFSYLLWRSQLCHEKGSVAWKGRLYATLGSRNRPVNARPVISETR